MPTHSPDGKLFLRRHFLKQSFPVLSKTFGQDLSKLFIVLRQLTAEDGPAFGKVFFGLACKKLKNGLYLLRFTLKFEKRALFA